MAFTKEQAYALVDNILGTDEWADAKVVPIDRHWYKVIATHDEGGEHVLRDIEEWKTVRLTCDLDPNGWRNHTCSVDGCLYWAEHDCPVCGDVTCDDHAAEDDGRCPYCVEQGAYPEPQAMYVAAVASVSAQPARFTIKPIDRILPVLLVALVSVGIFGLIPAAVVLLDLGAYFHPVSTPEAIVIGVAGGVFWLICLWVYTLFIRAVRANWHDLRALAAEDDTSTPAAA